MTMIMMWLKILNHPSKGFKGALEDCSYETLIKTIKNACRGLKIVFKAIWNDRKMIILQKVLKGAFLFLEKILNHFHSHHHQPLSVCCCFKELCLRTLF